MSPRLIPRLRPAVRSLGLTFVFLFAIVFALSLTVPAFIGEFINNPFAGTTAIIYTGLYLRMVYESEVEAVRHDLYVRRTAKEPKDWRIDKRVGQKFLEAENRFIDTLSNLKGLIGTMIEERFLDFSFADILKICTRLAILVVFITVTFGYLFFRLFRFSELGPFDRSVILLTFLTFSMRWSEKLSDLYNRLVEPFSEAAFQSKYSGTSDGG